LTPWGLSSATHFECPFWLPAETLRFTTPGRTISSSTYCTTVYITSLSKPEWIIIPANSEEMNSDDDERSERDEMDDSLGEDTIQLKKCGDDDDDDVDDDNDDDSSLGSDDEEIKEEIVEKFILTFSNGDYDDEFDDALKFDRGVTLPVRPTQASYHKPDNWRERNRIGLERVKEKLDYCIRLAIQEPNFNLNLTHNQYWNQLMDGEEPIVWHEQILDECWDQLEDTLSGDKLVTNICNIHVKNVEMKKERLATLVAILISGRATNSSTMIMFNNANICQEGIVSLSKLVDVSTTLQRFSISHNRIDSIESARCLSRSLRFHAHICELHLPHCDLGSTPEIILVILQSDVNYINLENNNIDSFGAVTIAEYLEGDPPIQRIDLEHNRLNDDDAVLISQALKRNTNLKTINLHSNNFASIGVKALLKCFFDNSSLNAVSESNHYLERLNIFCFDNMESNKNSRCIDRLLELDQFQKIVLALQDKDSLLKYLANVSVELIPEVLAFPCGWTVNEHKHKHLNIVYSTMRWWNMPMLYSYYNCINSDTKRKRDN
jgi:hypothetical protein